MLNMYIIQQLKTLVDIKTVLANEFNQFINDVVSFIMHTKRGTVCRQEWKYPSIF